MADAGMLPAERFAERTLVLVDSCAGLMARCARLGRITSAVDTQFFALKNPEWKSIRAKLVKAYPDLADLSREKQYESFQKAAASTLTELKTAYDLLNEVAVHAQAHLGSLKAMLAQIPVLSLATSRAPTIDVATLFNAYVRLVFYVSGVLGDRKVIASLYAAAHQCARGGADPNYARLAAPLRVFDEPAKALVEQFGDCTGPMSQMVTGYSILVQLAASGAAELGRRQALNLVDDAAGLSKPTTTPLTKVMASEGRGLHAELMECRRAMDFCVFATICCPSVLATPACLMTCQLSCCDCLAVELFRGASLNVHVELEALQKWYPTKPVQKAWPKDVKLFRVFKDWSKAAVLQCGLVHRERRAYLLGELSVIERLVASCPGLAAPKAPLCLAALALGVDEAKWQLRHANAMPRRDRIKHYTAEHFEEPRLAVFLGAVSQLEARFRRQRRDVARYHLEYLGGADADAVAKLLPAALSALPSSPAGLQTLVGGLADSLRNLRPMLDAVEEAAKRVDADGEFMGGRYSPAATKANPIAVFCLNWRRCAAAIAASANAKSQGLLKLTCRMNAVIDHCYIADGSLFKEHCALGALWPFRAQLLEAGNVAVAGDSAKTDHDSAAGMVQALLGAARGAVASGWHPACFEDLGDVEAGAKRLADAALENGLGGAIRTSLELLRNSIESLSEQIAPVQAAYRQERRENEHSKAAKAAKEKPKDEPSAGYESLAQNARFVEPFAHAEARMASLFACAKEYQGEVLLVADVLYRPDERARDAVLKFLKDEVTTCFFDKEHKLRRPTVIEKSLKAVFSAAQRAACYIDVDISTAVGDMLCGTGLEVSGIADHAAAIYVKIARGVLDENKAIYCPTRKSFAILLEKPEAVGDCEKYLSFAEVSALVRVLGNDGGRALDKALAVSAVDVMEQVRINVTHKELQPKYDRIKRGAMDGDWVNAAVELKQAGVLDKLLVQMVRLGNVLVLRGMVRESARAELKRVAPHLHNTSKLVALTASNAADRAKAVPDWHLASASVGVDEPRAFQTAQKNRFEKPPESFEPDSSLYGEAKALIDASSEWAALPYALAASLVADSWTKSRWLPDRGAFTNGAHVLAVALKATAHCFNGVAADDARSATRAAQVVAQYVESAAAMLTWMRIHETANPLFAELPLRAMCALLEIAMTSAGAKVVVESHIGRAFLEQHLPYPVIHTALMDISMGRNTAQDDKANQWVASVFDVKEAKEAA